MGDRFQNKAGDWYTVLEVTRSDNIVIQFDEGVTKRTKKQYIKSGSIRLPNIVVGKKYLDKMGRTVEVVSINGTSKVTFRWDDGYERTCQSSVITLNKIMREEDSSRLNPSLKTGDTGKLRDGTLWEVIEYKNFSNIHVKFLTDPPWYGLVSGGNLISGSVRNKGAPTLFGVGIIGDCSVNSNEMCYKSWSGMLKRVYYPHTDRARITYGNCSVIEEWCRLDNYKNWFDKQIVKEKWQLDKDLLIRGNKEYGPDVCIFLPREINTFLTNRHNCRGDWPIGVTYHKRLGKWEAGCNAWGEPEYLGVFDSPEKAFHAYKKRKEELAKELALKWMGIIDDRAYNALLKFEVNITD